MLLFFLSEGNVKTRVKGWRLLSLVCPLVIIAIHPAFFEINNAYVMEASYLAGFYILMSWFFYGCGVAIDFNYNIVRRIALLLCLIGLLQAVVGYMQWFGMLEMVSEDNWWAATGQKGGRVSGNIFQANNYATLIIMSIFAAFEVFLGRIAFSDKAHAKVTGWGLVLFLSGALALAQSRTGLLSLIITIIFLMVKSYNDNRAVFSKINIPYIIMAGINLMLFWLLPFLANIILNTASISRLSVDSSHRIDAWKMFFSAFMDSPLFGYGPGATASVNYQRVLDFQNLGISIFAHTHNILLDAALAGGAVMLVWLFFIVFRWVQIVKPLRLDGEKGVLFMMILPFVTHSLLELPHFYGYFLWPIMYFAGYIRSNEIN
ncbi:MAG: hypothetical protein RLZZ591_1741 [Pseudomonadota bacterium]